VERLENEIQEYAWGSKSAIADLLGRPSPSARPQAELWMGAHPSAPSRVLREGQWRSLLDVIGEDPEDEIGAATQARFGPRLPFLFKVLAAETPLSLQAHPTEAQAAAGFAAEERAGIAPNAPQRNYKDPRHKPELVCALGPFDALSGFRETRETAWLFRRLGVGALVGAARALERKTPSDALREVFTWILSRPAAERMPLVADTLSACARLRDEGGAFAAECDWALRIGALYPGDAGVVVSLLLNYVRLSPGEALYLSAGQLHAYLGGVAVEIMANSDNVLRAGLTPKHVDVPELLRILEFTDGPPLPRVPAATGAELVYRTPSPEFQLSRIELGPEATFHARVAGPEILLCTEGSVVARGNGDSAQSIARGTAMFVPARDATYELAGAGTVFRATVGEP
jgi:mannose-6-phosphate isomerase